MKLGGKRYHVGVVWKILIGNEKQQANVLNKESFQSVRITYNGIWDQRH